VQLGGVGQKSEGGLSARVGSALCSPLAPTLVVWLLVLAYALTFGTLSVLNHDSFGTSIYDLGNVDQAVWNTIHGRILQFTTQPHMGDIRLSMHIEPILIPISLLYLIYSSPKTLLVLQTLAMALGAWPLYLLARWKLGRPWPAVAFALAYLLLPALQAANLFEFHAVVIAPVFLIFAFYWMERAIAAPTASAEHQRYFWLGLVAAVLAMSCKEDVPLLVVMMGLYFLVVSHRPKVALPLIVLGSLWFYVDIYVVFKLVRTGKGSPFMYYYKDFGDNPVSIATNLLTHPTLFASTVLTRDNLQYMFGLLMPFGFLSILGLPALLIATPSLAINLLSGFSLMHELEAKQYAVPIAPFVAISAVYGTYYLNRWVRRLGRDRLGLYFATAALLCSALTYQYFRGFSPLSQAYVLPQVTAHDRLAQVFIRQIPPGAPLVAQDRLLPHVAERQRVYYAWTADTDADYVFLDVSHPSFVNVNGVHGWLKEQVEKQQDFGLIDARDGYLLLQRGAPRVPLPDRFFSFARVQAPNIQYPIAVDFGDALRLLGFDVVYDRDREVQLVMYWQALRPISEDYSLALYLADDGGRVVESTSAPQPALVWYPFQRWQPGENVRVLANTLPWSTQNRDRYGIAVSVSENTSAGDRRLLPLVQEAKNAMRALENGSLLELMRFEKVWGINRGRIAPRVLSRPPSDRPLAANFGNQAVLEGITLKPARAAPGRPLQVEMVWRSLRPMNESYTVFVHLIDSSGKIWSQTDSIPGGGLLPTTAWTPGEYIQESYAIPVGADAPQQGLRLEIGLYQGATGQRLEVLDSQGQPYDNRILVNTD
jgi:uncharacterized membrane protein